MVMRNVTWTYTISANGMTATNLATLIDADLPSGYKCVGIAGYRTNNNYTVPVAIQYSNVSDSLRLRNLSSSAVTSTTARIYYIAFKE